MTPDEYKRKFHVLIASMLQSKLIKVLDTVILGDYPNRLPGFVLAHYKQEIARIEKGIEEHSPKTIQVTPGESIPLLSVLTVLYLKQAGYEAQKVDVEQVVLSQHLVMVIAYLEAFLVDTVYAICKTKPELMKSQKRTLDWETVIGAGNFDNIIEFLAEQYSRSFLDGLTIAESIESLQKRLSLDIDFPETRIALLDNARNLRHSIVHNGGRADSKYLRQTRRTDLAVGQSIHVSYDSCYAVDVEKA